MRTFAGRDGLVVCCANAMEVAEQKCDARKIPHASKLCRRGCGFRIAQFSGIDFYFSVAASVRGAGVISMDQIDAGRMYMLAR